MKLNTLFVKEGRLHSSCLGNCLETKSCTLKRKFVDSHLKWCSSLYTEEFEIMLQYCREIITLQGV
jgi:hypothetical protein